MKFLHTADWQVGMRAEHVGEASERVRQERLKTGERVIQAAGAHEVDAILVTGDLFENNGVDRVLVQRVADILESSGRPVFIIPGNHDPYVPGSVWQHPAWSAAANLNVLTQQEPVDFGEALLFPCPLTEKYSPRNPTAWIDARDRSQICIGLAHGTVEGVPVEEPDYPIPRDAAARTGLDFLALGHWHSTATYDSEDGAVRMAYSGTHEPTKFGERDSGNVLVVEIARRGEEPQVTRVPTGALRWLTVEQRLHSPKDLDNLLRQVEAIEHPEDVLLSVQLGGLLFPDRHEALARLEELLQARFLFGRLDATRLRPSPEDDAWIESLPVGYIRVAARRLREQALAARDNDATAAAAALLELYAIAQEVGR